MTWEKIRWRDERVTPDTPNEELSPGQKKLWAKSSVMANCPEERTKEKKFRKQYSMVLEFHRDIEGHFWFFSTFLTAVRKV